TVVALMSGNFVQRGDVAIFDKKTRCEAALKCGADLVLELPTVMSMSTAERFASSGVAILEALNSVDYLAFGGESTDLSSMEKIAKILAFENEDYKTALSSHLKEGLPFATAREKALSSVFSGDAKLISSSNNILAVEYLKAILKLDSKMEPVLIKREGADYNSSEASSFMSATGIRKLISEGSSLSGFVPDTLLPLYENAKVHSLLNMEKSIIANLCKMAPDEIASLPNVSEGLENKIKKAAMESDSFDTLCDNIKSKRYAHSRIRRILLYSYLGITKGDMVAPQYIKILGFNEKGQRLLNKAKQEANLPLVKNFNQIKGLNNPLAENTWKKELIFDRIYDLF
ncbi:MAG: nucleotidyltransferase family protein, partial [Clostridia bacterium]|nr:nucleotidyltransferase family protein [Clostridia bacterium]